MPKKAKRVLTLVSGGGENARIRVSKKTDDLVARKLLQALKELNDDNYEYAQEYMPEGLTVGQWVRSAEELRVGICQSLIELANKTEDLANDIGESGLEQSTKKVANVMFRDGSFLLVSIASQFGQLQGLLDGKPKG